MTTYHNEDIKLEREECLLIPINNPTLVLLGKITIPLAMALFLIKIFISKSIDNVNCLSCFKKIGFKSDDRSYKEILINLIVIWLFCGQIAAGLSTLLYTKSDKHFMEKITGLPVDELSVYMPRFLFDEFVAVPLRYFIWSYIWEYIMKVFNIDDKNVYSDNKFILVKGIFWALNVFISITLAAIMIAFINYTV